jgi:hypothetical protein
MWLLLICGAGIILGLYYGVLILLPLSLVATGAFVAINVMSGQSLSASLGDWLLLLISGQAGYMLGLTARDAYAQIWARLNPAQSNRI